MVVIELANSAQQSPVIKATRHQAFRLLAMQGLMVTLLAVVWGLISNQLLIGASVLLGGIAYILPNFYFAYRFFSRMHAREARQILSTFYWEEFVKIVMNITLLLMILWLLPVLILPLFAGFLGAYLGLWLAPLFAR